MLSSKVLNESLVSRVFYESASFRGPKLLQERESHLADGHVPPQGVDENVTLLLNDLSIPLLPLPLREARAREPMMDVHHWSHHQMSAAALAAKNRPMKISIFDLLCGGCPTGKR
jgi:hypothetical protein